MIDSFHGQTGVDHPAVTTGIGHLRHEATARAMRDSINILRRKQFLGIEERNKGIEWRRTKQVNWLKLWIHAHSTTWA